MAQTNSINKAQQVIKRLNEENRDIAKQCNDLSEKIDLLEKDLKDYDDTKMKLVESKKDIDTLNKQIKIIKGKI